MKTCTHEAQPPTRSIERKREREMGRERAEDTNVSEVLQPCLAYIRYVLTLCNGRIKDGPTPVKAPHTRRRLTSLYLLSRSNRDVIPSIHLTFLVHSAATPVCILFLLPSFSVSPLVLSVYFYIISLLFLSRFITPSLSVFYARKPSLSLCLRLFSVCLSTVSFFLPDTLRVSPRKLLERLPPKATFPLFSASFHALPSTTSRVYSSRLLLDF